MSEIDAGALFREGHLDQAIAAAGRAVQAKPADVPARVLLAELLLFTGAFERADAIMAAADALDSDAALVVAEFRQLLRAATARREVFHDGRLPEFLGEPTEGQKAALAMLVALRAGDAAAVAEALAAAEAARPTVSGEIDGQRFEDFRDTDDLTGGSLEVLTTTGKYFWIPVERVVSMEFHTTKRPRDLVWRRCSMAVRDGPHGEVYLPALYDSEVSDDALRLGRQTDWSASTPVRGLGQRMFLVGDEGIAIGDLRTVEFT